MVKTIKKTIKLGTHYIYIHQFQSSDYLCLSLPNILYNKVKLLSLVLQQKKTAPLILVKIKIIYKMTKSIFTDIKVFFTCNTYSKITLITGKYTGNINGSDTTQLLREIMNHF